MKTIRGAINYALGGHTLKSAMSEVRMMNRMEHEMEIDRDWKWKLRGLFPELFVRLDLFSLLFDEVKCYCLGHQWVETADCENGSTALFCRRCGFESETKYW